MSAKLVEGHVLGVENNTQSRIPASKWNALIEDTAIPAPQQVVPAKVLLAQAGVGGGKVLVRDQDGGQDQAIGGAEMVDLALGNVFYVLPECDAPFGKHHLAPPKLAFFVDDRPEITINPNQTGKTIRELFGLSDDVILERDYESPNDELIEPNDAAPFVKGPVFITRHRRVQLHIVVNSKPFTEKEGVKKKMKGREVAALVTDTPDRTEVFRLHKDAPKEDVPLDKEIPIHDCDEFRVIRKDVAGGFEPSRVHRELAKLKQGGMDADFVEQPIPSVIYRNVPARPGYPHLEKTDVLVPVPGGYPGAMIDGAYLPQGSPLLNRVVGAVQGTIMVEGRGWQLVSYHPHNGGGGPPWNKDKHGFHTYVDEILCWIHNAKS